MKALLLTFFSFMILLATNTLFAQPPVPDALKPLEPFIGEWEGFVQPPNRQIPRGMARMKCRWLSGKHFVQFEVKLASDVCSVNVEHRPINLLANVKRCVKI